MYRFQSDGTDRLIGKADHERSFFNDLPHIAVLVGDHDLHSTFSVFFIQQVCSVLHCFFPSFKQMRIVFPDDICSGRNIYIPGHMDQMEKSFITLRISRGISCRQQTVEFTKYERSIDHFILGASRMDTESVNIDSG